MIMKDKIILKQDWKKLIDAIDNEDLKKFQSKLYNLVFPKEKDVSILE